MPRAQSQRIVHTFGGGWATDYGATYYGSPQNGQIVLPWLSQAENAIFTRGNHLAKWPGTRLVTNQKLIDPSTNSSWVQAVTDYWRMETFSTQRVVAATGQALFDITSPVPVLIDFHGTGTPWAPVHMSVFNDLLIIARNNNSSPRSWDQTTYQTLAGTPPSFAFSTAHKGRHWAAGHNNFPSRLYYSAVGNPEDWIGTGSGAIDIDPGDGDEIVALVSWKDELFVFKGPNRLSIHRISGSSPTDFARKTFVVGVSAAGPSALFHYGNDIGFWSPRGSCHSLLATDTYGDYEQAFLNYPILSWCRDPKNINKFSSYWFQTVTHYDEGYTLFIYSGKGAPFDDVPVNNECILMDWKFIGQGEQYPRFSRLTYAPFTSVSLVKYEGQSYPYFGTHDGFVYRTRSFDAYEYAIGGHTHELAGQSGSKIPYRIQSPYLTYGPDIETKTISHLGVSLSANHRSQVTIKWGGTKFPKQTITFNSFQFVPLGTFVLGKDVMGEVGDQPTYAQELNGDFRSIQYNIIEESNVVNSESNGIEIAAFDVALAPTGESMESLGV